MNSQFLENKYVNGILTLFIVLYASMIGPELPKVVKNMFSNTIFKMFILFLVIIMGSTDPKLAIIIAIAFVLTMDFLYVHDTKEAFSNVFTADSINLSGNQQLNITHPFTNVPINNTDEKVVDFMKFVKRNFMSEYYNSSKDNDYNMTNFTKFFFLGLYVYNINPTLDHNTILQKLAELYLQDEKNTSKFESEGQKYYRLCSDDISNQLTLIYYSLSVSDDLMIALQKRLKTSTMNKNDIKQVVALIVQQYKIHKKSYDEGSKEVKDSFNMIWLSLYIGCFYDDNFNDAYDVALYNIIDKTKQNDLLYNKKIKEDLIKIKNQNQEKYTYSKIHDKVKLLENWLEELMSSSHPQQNSNIMPSSHPQ